MRGIDFNEEWLFCLEDKIDGHLPELCEQDFRKIKLPHDWSVELPFNKDKGEACTGYLLGGIGWYRKHFVTTREMKQSRVFIDLDGVYERTEIYINGEIVEFHPYGYSPCLLEITTYLSKEGQDNVIALRVDHMRYANSRWYTGSGIYRKVSLFIIPQVGISVWGVSIETKEVRDDKAVVTGLFKLENASNLQARREIRLYVYNPDKKRIISKSMEESIAPMFNREITFSFEIDRPELWEIYDGRQYILQIEVLEQGNQTQVIEEKFGIREYKFDTEKGFIFNGRNTLIKGVCLHHDGGAVGAAVPLDVWKRRLQHLKLCGCNAIRTAHNPVSEDFLTLCDDMGFLVMEEFFDEWDNPKDKRHNGSLQNEDIFTRSYTEFFRDYSKHDLQNVILRDRNHPCIFLWSIGNEIEWTYSKYNKASGYFNKDTDKFWYWWNTPPYSVEEIKKHVHRIAKSYYDISSTAKKLSTWVRELDMSRPVVANCILPSVSYENGYIDSLDIVGYSYRSVLYKYGKKYYGNKPILGTENVGKWREWKAVLENNHISGIFLWTGIDHMGEAWVQKSWPRKGSNLGLLDFAGFEKPAYYMFQSLWTDKCVIHIETQTLEKSLYKVENGCLTEKERDGWLHDDWHWQEVNPYWDYVEGEEIVVEVYSNCEKLTLYCNERIIGALKLSDIDDHIYKWCLPFEYGTLKVTGSYKGKEAVAYLHSVGSLDSIRIRSDKSELEVSQDAVAHVEVQLLDQNGYMIKNREEEIVFNVSENAKIIGIDNGNPDNVRDCQGHQINSWHGRALVYIQAIQSGTIYVWASCDKIKTEVIQITVK